MKLYKSDFIERANKKHNGKYDYSKIEFVNAQIKVMITCPIHGDFEQRPTTHLLGIGCPKCGRESTTNSRKDTLEKFIEKSRKVHGDKYDYSKSIYYNSQHLILIKCPIHGYFTQLPMNHVKGCGCPKCGGTGNLTTKEFILKAKEVHGDKYDYFKSVYTNNSTPLIITCPIHGDFEQRPNNHFNGKGCPKCGIEKISLLKFDNTESFILKAKEVHGDKYLYTNVDYSKSRENVLITCRTHGDFEQMPNHHLMGEGCPKCAKERNSERTTSKQELELQKFVSSLINNVNNSWNILDSKELDIFIPEKNIAIEYNGLYWHSEIHKEKDYHIQKTEECLSKDIKLIHIFEDEWLYKQEIVKSRLKNILGITDNHIFARKCDIKFIDTTTEKLFLENNHIQGHVNSTFCYGLYYNNELISIMSFGNLRKNLGNTTTIGEYELLRFCNKLNYTVVGGASKLFKHFIKKYNPNRIISYCDRRWSTGNLYEKLNFSFVKNTEPNYFYIIGDKRFNRFSFRKDILISKHSCSPEDTEKNFCYNQGWYRIYDCGTKLYEYKK